MFPFKLIFDIFLLNFFEQGNISILKDSEGVELRVFWVISTHSFKVIKLKSARIIKAGMFFT